MRTIINNFELDDKTIKEDCGRKKFLLWALTYSWVDDGVIAQTQLQGHYSRTFVPGFTEKFTDRLSNKGFLTVEIELKLVLN